MTATHPGTPSVPSPSADEANPVKDFYARNESVWDPANAERLERFVAAYRGHRARLGSSSYTGRNSAELVEGATASGSPRLIVISVPSGWYYKVITSGVALAAATLIPA
ncbi:MAG: hypothetical protein E6I33_11040 [Chloroflexi bacterium]|nr:MAG: hypothetical protein E6I33_11040 [Chloroflexota bacterium]